MKKIFDYVVIGGGSGGLSSARRAAKLGKQVCLIESLELGGTCVNKGCVPKKIMWNAASMLHDLKLSSEYGISTETSFNWATLKSNRNSHISDLHRIYAANLSKDGVSHINGFARFKDSYTVEVDGYGKLSAPHILISTGSKPIMPDIPGKEHISNSDDFFAIESAPESALIIGNGYIASELTGLLNTFGTKTSITLRHDQFLGNFDRSISGLLREVMENSGITFLPNRNVVQVKRQEKKLVAIFDTGEEHPYEKIFACIGRKACLLYTSDAADE